VGPADRIKMPLVLELLLKGRAGWIQSADPEAAKLVAKEREGGLVIYKVQIPLSLSGHVVYAVDAKKWWVRQLVYEDRLMGRGQLHVRHMSCRPEAGAKQFVLDIPSGVPITDLSTEENRPLTMEEAQMAVPYPLRKPSDLPEGTRFARAHRQDAQVVLVYVGEKPFRLIQGPGIDHAPYDPAAGITIRGRKGTAMPDTENGGWRITWYEDGLQFLVVGPLERKEILRIAKSLELAFKSQEVGGNANAGAEQGR
jgi:hypothetical protein